MPHFGKRSLIHASAFLIGLLAFNWTLLGLCIFAHYLVSPAQVAQMNRVKDIEDFKRNQDHEGASAFARTMNILTLQSSLFSGLWYLVGLGLGSLF